MKQNDKVVLIKIFSTFCTIIDVQVEIEQPLVMFMQVAGKTQILVDSWKPCNEVCLPQSNILHAGEICKPTNCQKIYSFTLAYFLNV